MKKNLFLSLTAILFVAIISLTSCVKYVTSTPYVINDSITATVSGYAIAPLDLSNSTDEYAPAGTKIYVKVSLDEYNPDAPSDQYKVYTATVGSNGEYTFTIPSTSKGVNFTIFGEDFRTSQVQFDGTTQDDVIFISYQYNGFVVEDQHFYQDINYTD